jgi:biopolymer transport protein ExbB
MKRYLTKSIVALLMVGLLTAMLIATENGMNDSEVPPSYIDENFESIFDDVPTMSNLELFARKLVGGFMVKLFIDGGWLMWPILFLGIWGMAICIWKLVALSYAKINTTEFINTIIPLVKEKKYEEAIKLCADTRGPVSTVISAGLMKVDRGVPAVEKAIENTATIEMAFLEKQFISMSTVINLAPLVGFFGTILGMIVAFDAIAAAGDVDPTIVADGISLALITTLAGLAVAIPVQLFFNILMQMVDNIVLDMQRTIDKVTETLVENK